jgi:hypothetical protein
MISWNNTGPQGATGAPGISTAYYAANFVNTVSLNRSALTPVAAMSAPAGNYLVTVTVTVNVRLTSFPGSDNVLCILDDPAQDNVAYAATGLSAEGSDNGTANISVTVPAEGGGNIVFSCIDANGQAEAYYRVITATPISNLVASPPTGPLGKSGRAG